MSDTALSPQRAAWLRARRRRQTAVRTAQICLLPAFLLLWEAAARLAWIDPFIFSSPSRAAASLASLWRSGDLWLHLGTSCLETAAGFTLGTLLGAAAAVVLWWSDFASAVLNPYLVVLNALPKTALGPIFIVWMGAGAGSIIAMVAGSSWAVLTFWSSTTQSKQETMILSPQTQGSPGSSRPPSQPVQSGLTARRVILPSGEILPMALAEKSAT